MSANDFIKLGEELRDALTKGQAEFDAVARRRGLKARKAYYLVSIADAFGGATIPREKLLSAGWTKLEMLTKRANDVNLPTLVDQAIALPVSELRRVLEGKQPRAKKHVVLLNLSPDQYEILAQVLEAHGGIRVGRTIAGKEAALMAALTKLIPPSS